MMSLLLRQNFIFFFSIKVEMFEDYSTISARSECVNLNYESLCFVRKKIVSRDKFNIQNEEKN